VWEEKRDVLAAFLDGTWSLDPSWELLQGLMGAKNLLLFPGLALKESQ
jgi:hypothetical protein